MKPGLGRIVRNSSEWGKGWRMKFNTNRCKVTSIRGKVLGASYTAQNMGLVSSAREPSPVVIARGLGEYPGVGRILKSFPCLPVSAVTGPGALRAAAHPSAAGGRKRGWKSSWMQWLLVHFGRSGPALCANPTSVYIKLSVSYSTVPSSWHSNPVALQQAEFCLQELYLGPPFHVASAWVWRVVVPLPSPTYSFIQTIILNTVEFSNESHIRTLWHDWRGMQGCVATA